MLLYFHHVIHKFKGNWLEAALDNLNFRELSVEDHVLPKFREVRGSFRVSADWLELIKAIAYREISPN